MYTVVLPAALLDQHSHQRHHLVKARCAGGGHVAAAPSAQARQGDDVVVVRHDLGRLAPAAGHAADCLEIELYTGGDGLDEEEDESKDSLKTKIQT